MSDQALPALLKATRTLSQAPSKVLPRQVVTTTIVANNDPDDAATLSDGAIAGIVIGSIVGFLILLWIIRSCINLAHPGIWGQTFGASTEKVDEPDYHEHRHHHHHRHRSHSRHSSYGGRSPRRRSTSRPVYVHEQTVTRRLRTPSPVYYARDSRELGRSGRGRAYYGY